MALVEVHSVTRPGRPALLVLLTGALLAGSLGLAWYQSHEKRALGDPTPIEDTPLIVRVPRDWVQSPTEPGLFLLADRKHVDALSELEREVQFRYLRRRGFEPPERVIRTWDRSERSQSSEPSETHIRGIRAVQVRRIRMLSIFGHRLVKESLLRVACHPRGDIIAVEYSPTAELTGADLELFDLMCAGIEFSDPELNLTGDDAKKNAGLDFPTRKNWHVAGPVHPGTPVVHVVAGRAGRDGWVVQAARSWLSATRTPADLLYDAVVSVRPELRERLRTVEWGRKDGVSVAAAMVDVDRSSGDGAYVAFALSRAEGEVGLVLTDFADISRDSLSTARDLADHLNFASWPNSPDWAAAGAAGEELAKRITTRGASTWWSRAAVRAAYQAAIGEKSEIACCEKRSATSGSPERGYAFAGQSMSLDTSTKHYRQTSWTIDDRAEGYSLQHEVGVLESLLPGSRGLISADLVRETREPGGPVRRKSGMAASRTEETEFVPGPAFVCPPAEELAAAEVAGWERGEALIQVSNPTGRGENARFLRPLLPDASGDRRVL
ncbi:MAG: hypothetical protein HZB38_11505, partial [Planctomycetes bacterium]|nr:hypothetical protein [Planctomycetota bacterium]